MSERRPEAARPADRPVDGHATGNMLRHHATRHLVQYFSWSHLPPNLREVSAECAVLADSMVHQLPDGPELTAGLRKLLEAKDCFVRAAMRTP